MPLRALVLAAGKGTRMKSDLPKVIHPILNKPMISYVLDAVNPLKPEKTYIIVGYRKEMIGSIVDGCNLDVEYILQNRQLGTGHAISRAETKLKSYRGDILIINGDSPAITSKELKKFVSKHKRNRSILSLMTSKVENPYGYGRIVRDSNNKIQSIIEEKDATVKQRKINVVNSGIYCVKSKFLWETLRKLKTNNKQKEYYLPDIVKFANTNGIKVLNHNVTDPNEILGVNDKAELSELESYIKTRVHKKLYMDGITVVDPTSTFISPDVKIGSDTVINPNTYLYGDTKIGKSCLIGPNVYIDNSVIGKNVEIRFSSFLNGCTIENNVTVGPFSHLRPEAHIGNESKIGNFVEIKKSKIGIRSKVPHLSYVGDAVVGQNVNIGAGTITCNYDGVNKHQTIIEDNVFIGSDSMLVAPVRVGKGAITAAGSTITKDVDKDSLAIERNQQKIIKGWSKRKKKK
ncbi:MAG: bifunctional UDP-N-acetylglucosamine diphosphorylase/glucosamine-1-phosphate N-acetyltransferase GlmU [Thermodesulfobacteriota bacterium]